jgi:hypothetical protein
MFLGIGKGQCLGISMCDCITTIIFRRQCQARRSNRENEDRSGIVSRHILVLSSRRSTSGDRAHEISRVDALGRLRTGLDCSTRRGNDNIPRSGSDSCAMVKVIRVKGSTHIGKPGLFKRIINEHRIHNKLLCLLQLFRNEVVQKSGKQSWHVRNE